MVREKTTPCETPTEEIGAGVGLNIFGIADPRLRIAGTRKKPEGGPAFSVN